ncbi:MAG: S41 family peptidase [Lachnospiraceae bacterium]|nr:S41 family peptidase [Lachnospiraceae bacterium]
MEEYQGGSPFDQNNSQYRPLAGETVEAESMTQTAAPAPKKVSRLRWLLIGIFVGTMTSLIVVIAMLVFHPGIQLTLTNALISKSKGTVLNREAQDKVDLIEDTIEQYYLEDVDEETLRDGLYDGLVKATGDKYADYYNEKDLQDVTEKNSGIFYGIGAYVTIDADTEYPKLSGIMEGTPAEAAGLKAEDIVVKVNGQDVGGMELTDAVALIKGPQGTKVTLTILRAGEKDYREIEVTRDKVESPTVTYEKLEDGIAYIRIMQFDTVTTNQFAEKLQQARDDGMKGLILDLRSNPGGMVESVVEIARMMLPKGLIVYTEDKYGNKKEYKCDGENELEVPMTVLINENSASASEILAGAIKDYGIGTLVGKTTYGKGIVQKVFRLTDGTALKLTISHYYSPKGNDIHEVGIKPDQEVELDAEKYVKDGVDTQLDEAIKILKEKIK